ncbi:MAG: hypothetical protein IT385_30005 [Deltaproteobacteria bacterium]|nr:hypothetical protein [Deltaproteobacteria bacterium]
MSSRVVILAVVFGLSSLACDPPEPPSDEVGTVAMPLTSTSGGVTYRVLPGELRVYKKGDRIPLLTVTDFSPDTLELTLSPGNYVLELAGWRLFSEASQSEVDAVLLSDERQEARVLPGRTAQVVYRFMPVNRAQSEVEVAIDVDAGVTIGGVIHPDEVSPDFDSPDFEEIPFNLFFVVDYEGFGGTDNEGNWSRVYLTSPVRVELDHESVMVQAAADAISGSDVSVSAWDGALDDPTIIVMTDEAQPYFMAVVVDPGPVDEQGKPALVSHVGTCLVTLFHEDLGVLIESRDRPCWISR